MRQFFTDPDALATAIAARIEHILSVGGPIDDSMISAIVGATRVVPGVRLIAPTEADKAARRMGVVVVGWTLLGEDEPYPQTLTPEETK